MIPTPTACLKEIATGVIWTCRTSLGPDPSKFITRGCGDFIVGRAIGSEIALTSRMIGRKHAILRLFDADLFVHDCSSRNGTYVNEQRIEGKWWCPLRPGDVVQFSDVALRVLWIGEGESPLKKEWLTWNDGTVVKLATCIERYEFFSTLPILADALEEAGCSDSSVLNACREAEFTDLIALLLALIQ